MGHTVEATNGAGPARPTSRSCSCQPTRSSRRPGRKARVGRLLPEAASDHRQGPSCRRLVTFAARHHRQTANAHQRREFFAVLGGAVCSRPPGPPRAPHGRELAHDRLSSILQRPKRSGKDIALFPITGSNDPAFCRKAATLRSNTVGVSPRFERSRPLAAEPGAAAGVNLDRPPPGIHAPAVLRQRPPATPYHPEQCFYSGGDPRGARPLRGGAASAPRPGNGDGASQSIHAPGPGKRLEPGARCPCANGKK